MFIEQVDKVAKETEITRNTSSSGYAVQKLKRKAKTTTYV